MSLLLLLVLLKTKIRMMVERIMIMIMEMVNYVSNNQIIEILAVCGWRVLRKCNSLDFLMLQINFIFKFSKNLRIIPVDIRISPDIGRSALKSRDVRWACIKIQSSYFIETKIIVLIVIILMFEFLTEILFSVFWTNIWVFFNIIC